MKARFGVLLVALSLAGSLQGRQASAPAGEPPPDLHQLIANGNYEAADRVFAEELQRHPGDFALTYNRALVNYLAGNFEKSRDQLLSVPAAERGHINYQALLASNLTHLGDFKGAVAPSVEVVKLAPSDPENWLRLAGLYLRLKKGQHATDVYRAGLWRFPTRPEFLIGLGVIEEMQAKMDSTISIYRQVVEQFPQQAVGYQFLGHAQVKANQAAEAQKTAEKLLLLDPRSAYAEYLLGEAAWTRPGREQDAAEHAQRALQLDPKLVEARLLAAKVELRVGDPHKAIAYLKEVTNNQPRVEAAHYLLAQACRRIGDTREADAELAAFRKLRQAGDNENQLLSNFVAGGPLPSH